MSPKVSYSDLEEAFLLASYDRHYWLDKQTGRMLSYSSEAAEAVEDDDLSDLPGWMHDEVSIAREVLRALGELPEEYSHCSVAGDQGAVADPAAVPGSIEAEHKGSDASIEENVHNTGASESNRYVPIEQIPSNEAFQFMADFAGEVADSRIRDILQRALRGNRPFHRFRDALSNFSKERERWFAYESIRRRDYIQDWAREEGVEIDFSADVA
ncbi:MAG: UPF0158 family protein [Blastocatellia bacterium]